MMIGCPGCNHQYVLDETKLPPRGAILTCQECGKKWRLRGSTQAARDDQTTGSTPAGGTAALPQAGPSGGLSAAAGSAPRPAPAQASGSPGAAGAAAASAHSVTCPRCGHAFQPQAGLDASRAQRRVLLIEDQNYFAELAREALAGDCDVVVVGNLAGARATMAQERFELVILDLGLEEGQDGAQLLSQLRQKKIPVLVFTARDETELYGGVWDTLHGAGATDILIKGVNVGEELRQKVRALLPGPA